VRCNLWLNGTAEWSLWKRALGGTLCDLRMACPSCLSGDGECLSLAPRSCLLYSLPDGKGIGTLMLFAELSLQSIGLGESNSVREMLLWAREGDIKARLCKLQQGLDCGKFWSQQCVQHCTPADACAQCKPVEASLFSVFYARWRRSVFSHVWASNVVESTWSSLSLR
jgi:hypothetical protein